VHRSGGTNLALGRPATSSSFDQYNGNFTAGQATDGNYATRWSSKWTDGEWIQVDLGAKKTFHNVQLAWESAYGKGYTIQQSDDGTTWSPIATVTNGDGSCAPPRTASRRRRRHHTAAKRRRRTLRGQNQ